MQKRVIKSFWKKAVKTGPPDTAFLTVTEIAPGKTLRLVLRGRLDDDGAAQVWEKIEKIVAGVSGATVDLDVSAVTYCDGAGLALLLDLRCLAENAKTVLTVTGLREEFGQLLSMFDVKDIQGPAQTLRGHRDLPSEIGHAASRVWADIFGLIEFVGEFWSSLIYVATRPKAFRWKDALHFAENTGADSLPIIILIGFLMGLITAFQSAMPLRQFGAEIFVANLLGLSMLRELGPLVSGIIMAGRSGSAFAAELGTMRVNEEINALVTMGLDPVRFLVIPRVLAAMAVMPLIVMFFNFFALIGGGVVMVSLGYPIITYSKQVVASVSLTDMLGGLFKSVVFSHLVCGIGCLRGLQASGGPSAVGDSATSAVVSGIILIAVFDGIFAVLFFALKI
ncbi:MAG: ABC transporter permease [Desulfovibrionaceae bacterium]|nr:ABC transporter permease [Desulfovibrionaceae bacterium]MBF0512612.1 ABC transporter permease [Desulfovibrionaceae bacterium]